MSVRTSRLSGGGEIGFTVVSGEDLENRKVEWRHWRCVDPTLISQIPSLTSVDGFLDLNPSDQPRVIRALIRGHVDEGLTSSLPSPSSSSTSTRTLVPFSFGAGLGGGGRLADGEPFASGYPGVGGVGLEGGRKRKREVGGSVSLEIGVVDPQSGTTSRSPPPSGDLKPLSPSPQKQSSPLACSKEEDVLASSMRQVSPAQSEPPLRRHLSPPQITSPSRPASLSRDPSQTPQQPPSLPPRQTTPSPPPPTLPERSRTPDNDSSGSDSDFDDALDDYLRRWTASRFSDRRLCDGGVGCVEPERVEGFERRVVEEARRWVGGRRVGVNFLRVRRGLKEGREDLVVETTLTDVNVETLPLSENAVADVGLTDTAFTAVTATPLTGVTAFAKPFPDPAHSAVTTKLDGLELHPMGSGEVGTLVLEEQRVLRGVMMRSVDFVDATPGSEGRGGASFSVRKEAVDQVHRDAISPLKRSLNASESSSTVLVELPQGTRARRVGEGGEGEDPPLETGRRLRSLGSPGPVFEIRLRRARRKVGSLHEEESGVGGGDERRDGIFGGGEVGCAREIGVVDEEIGGSLRGVTDHVGEEGGVKRNRSLMTTGNEDDEVASGKVVGDGRIVTRRKSGEGVAEDGEDVGSGETMEEGRAAKRKRFLVTADEDEEDESGDKVEETRDVTADDEVGSGRKVEERGAVKRRRLLNGVGACEDEEMGGGRKVEEVECVRTRRMSLRGAMVEEGDVEEIPGERKVEEGRGVKRRRSYVVDGNDVKVDCGDAVTRKRPKKEVVAENDEDVEGVKRVDGGDGPMRQKSFRGAATKEVDSVVTPRRSMRGKVVENDDRAERRRRSLRGFVVDKGDKGDVRRRDKKVEIGGKKKAWKVK
ncbi:hypothetical protein HDU67_002784 [Dinochytrium kinnereticum]|nr:hypothetical protein HDU67_002784 [Dinochytrium kinnereticum]